MNTENSLIKISKEADMQIDHVRLLVTHFAECFRFYRDIIGLTVKWGTETDTYGSFTGENKAEVNLAIFDRRSMAEAIGSDHMPIDSTGQDKSMLIIGVDDIDTVVAKLVDLGVNIINGPLNHPDWGMRSAYLRDPDGNLIELTGGLSQDQWSPSLQEASKRFQQE
jgi:lactoylglutathione lyase